MLKIELSGMMHDMNVGSLIFNSAISIGGLLLSS